MLPFYFFLSYITFFYIIVFVYYSRFSKYVCFYIGVWFFWVVSLRSFGRSKLKDCSEKRVNVFDAVDICDFWDCVGMDDWVWCSRSMTALLIIYFAVNSSLSDAGTGRPQTRSNRWYLQLCTLVCMFTCQLTVVCLLYTSLLMQTMSQLKGFIDGSWSVKVTFVVLVD